MHYEQLDAIVSELVAVRIDVIKVNLMTTRPSVEFVRVGPF